jgi:hypothetical protein
VNRTQLKVSGLVNGLTLLEAEFVNHRYERHFHDELVLAITKSGTARINCWGRWFTAGPGDIFVANPNNPQAAITFGATWKYRAFYLTRHGLDHLAHVLDLETFPRLNCGVFQSAALAEDLGVRSRNGKNRTLRPSKDHLRKRKTPELY